MIRLKLAIIGGAGIRTPAIVQGLIRRHRDIPVEQLTIHDIDTERIETIGAIVQYLAQKQRAPFNITWTSDILKAVQNADFIYTAIRVGGEEGRTVDERVPLSYGVLGQETTGPGGFAMALRTIPVMLEYADVIEKTAPNAWVVNFTNPAGLITEALRKFTRLKAIGICDAPSSLKLDIAKFLNKPADSVHVRYFGLNHLGWIDRVIADGADRLPEIIEHYENFTEVCPHMACFPPALVRQLNMIPNEYLYYYYFREQAVSNMIANKRTRGEQISELNRRLMEELKQKLKRAEIEKAFHSYCAIVAERQNSYMAAETGRAAAKSPNPKMPQPSQKESGFTENEGYADLAMSVMASIVNDRTTCLILNVPNQGAIEGMRHDDIVEVPCLLDRNGPVPLAVGTLPDTVKGLVQSVKQYERLTVSAAVHGSYEDALMALTVPPLVCSYPLAKRILDDYLVQHERYLPQFKKRGTVHA